MSRSSAASQYLALAFDRFMVLILLMGFAAWAGMWMLQVYGSYSWPQARRSSDASPAATQ